MANIGAKLGDVSPCIKLGLAKIRRAYLGETQIYTGSASEPTKGVCADNTTGTATVDSYFDCCGQCNENCSGATPLKTWTPAPCDAGSGCCCQAENAVVELTGTTNPAQCSQCCAPSYVCNDQKYIETSCADCPPGYTCNDYSYTDPDTGQRYPYIDCRIDNKLVATCAECPGISCAPQTVVGDCGTWQPDCQVLQIVNSCWATATPITVTVSGAIPNRPDQPPNAFGVIWGPSVMYPVGGWNGGVFKFSNGGNNGWVGIWPDCDGKWRIYVYGGYFPGWATRIDPVTPVIYSQLGDGSPSEAQKNSTYKTSDGTCDPTGVHESVATFYDYSAPWGMPPGKVARIPFPVTVTVTPA